MSAPRNPDHDQHAAGLYRATALRFHARYVDAQHHAQFSGGDLEGAEPLMSQREASERYQKAVDEWLSELPNTVAAILALVEFAGVIAADKLSGEALRESGPVSDEQDAYHQVIALAAVGGWLNDHVTAEWLERRRKAYGPGGMPS